MKSKNQGDRPADKQEEKQTGRQTGQTDIQINLYRQINRYEKWHAEKEQKRTNNNNKNETNEKIEKIDKKKSHFQRILKQNKMMIPAYV